MYHRQERDQPHHNPHCLASLAAFRDERVPERFQLKPDSAKKWRREHPIENAGCDQGDERDPQTVRHVLDRMVSLRPVNVFREAILGGIEIEVGAEDGIRTRDLRFTKPLLYQLSYFGLKAE